MVTTETAQALIHLAKWLSDRFDLPNLPKVRYAGEAEQIHAEIVRRLGEANVMMAPGLMPAALDAIQAASHEADDPQGPWTPIKNGVATKRYICTRLDR